MGSTRFPGKVVSDIAGLSLIEHILYRLKQSKYISEIVIVTSNNKENDCLSKIAKKNNIHIIRGSENNVLGRFELAVRKFKPNNVVRICGDCPLIDPKYIDRCLNALGSQKVDYLKHNCESNVHQGVDAFSISCFEKILQYKENRIAKEHVSAIIKEYPENFQAGVLELLEFDIFLLPLKDPRIL